MIWDWLCGLSASEVRDIVLSVATPIAMCFAWWRLRIADRQEENTRHGQQNDRFKTGVELLGHNRPAVRQGAICLLGELSFLHPNDNLHITIMRIFVSYLAHPPQSKTAGKFVVDGPDIEEIERVFRRRSAIHRATEETFGFSLAKSLEPTIFSFKSGRLSVDERKREAREQARFGVNPLPPPRRPAAP